MIGGPGELTGLERLGVEVQARGFRDAADNLREQLADARPVLEASYGEAAAEYYLAGVMSVVEWLEQYARALDTILREGR